MKKAFCVLAALATIAVAAPTMASAEGESAPTMAIMATVTTIAAEVLNSTAMIEDGIAAGTIIMATV
jgi:hypothetical protein